MPSPMEDYDDVYRRPEFYWGKEPNSLCKLVTEIIPADQRRGKSVVDLGCGEGKDIVHFAKNGFDATGVDISSPGLGKAEAWAKKLDLKVAVVKSDINSYRLTETYDVVYSSGSLTYISPEMREETISNYKEHTSRGGINAFNAFIEVPGQEVPPDWGTEEHFFHSGELQAHYGDWEILHFSEDTFKCDSSGISHDHTMETLIFRKPDK